jgi:cysteine synthase A
MGIGLAQACRYFGLRFICVVDPKTAPQNLKMLEVYGAEINHVTEPDPASGEFLQARLARVQELLGTIPGSFWPNQYQTALNPQSHYQTTMHEIVTELLLDPALMDVERGVDPIRSLKALLKVMSRRFGLRCVAVEEQEVRND